MAKLSSAAWIAHNLGLAVSIGGTLFGQRALQPALREIESDRERARVADAAWRRFSWLNLAAHGVVAATWFAGRTMLSGREVSGRSRQLTLAKDALVVASLVTGVASIIISRTLGSRIRDASLVESPAQEQTNDRLRRVVGVLGLTNVAANAGIGAVTTALSMEASHSVPFSFVSRRLP
jgi:uncharacterized membrane protein